MREPFQPREFAVGAIALETRVIEAAQPDSFGQGEATVADTLGGSGWFLALGLAVAGAKPRILFRCAASSGLMPHIWDVANRFGISLVSSQGESLARFVSRVRDSQVVQRLAFCGSVDSSLVLEAVSGGVDVLAVGYTEPLAFHEVAGGLRAIRERSREAFVGYAPSNSVGLFDDLGLWINQVSAAIDVVVLNRSEFDWLLAASSLTKASLVSLLDPAVLVVTDGENPVVAMSRSVDLEQRVERISGGDAIGAGDIFAAVLFRVVRSGIAMGRALAIASSVATAMCNHVDLNEKYSVGRRVLLDSLESRD